MADSCYLQIFRVDAKLCIFDFSMTSTKYTIIIVVSYSVISSCINSSYMVHSYSCTLIFGLLRVFSRFLFRFFFPDNSLLLYVPNIPNLSYIYTLYFISLGEKYKSRTWRIEDHREKCGPCRIDDASRTSARAWISVSVEKTLVFTVPFCRSRYV